jgi:SPP1 family predicted phage head-tail adaptor
MLNNIKLSELNRRITLEIATSNTNGMGGAKVEWKQQNIVWGMIKECKKNSFAFQVPKQKKDTYILAIRYTISISNLLETLRKPTLNNMRFQCNINGHHMTFIPQDITLDDSERYFVCNAYRERN